MPGMCNGQGEAEILSGSPTEQGHRGRLGAEPPQASSCWLSHITPWQLGSQILPNSLCRNPQCYVDRSDKRLPVHSFVVSKGHDISPWTLVFTLQYRTENLCYKRNVIFHSLPIPTPEGFFFLLSTCLCAYLPQPLHSLSFKAAKL